MNFSDFANASVNNRNELSDIYCKFYLCYNVDILPQLMI